MEETIKATESPATAVNGQMPSDQEKALAYRAAWMRALGIPQDEIVRFCNPDEYPVDLEEERSNWEASGQIEELSLSSDQLRRIAAKYPPPQSWYDE